MLTRAAPGGATYFMLVGDAGDGHGGCGVERKVGVDGSKREIQVPVPCALICV
jgi:hypothetical protein